MILFITQLLIICSEYLLKEHWCAITLLVRKLRFFGKPSSRHESAVR